MPTRNSIKQFRTFMEESRRKSKPSQTALKSLRPSLPGGWELYFSARKAGSHWGLTIQCPHCLSRPPKDVRPWQRWRWLAVHVAEHK